MTAIRKMDQIEDEAAQWVWRLDGDFSEQERGAFEQWLEKDSRHLAAFKDYVQLWGNFDALQSVDLDALAAVTPELPREASESQNTDKSATVISISQRWWRPVTAMAASLVAALAIWMFVGGAGPAAQIYQTAVGESRVLVLDDGSTINLNTNTLVEVLYGGESRHLILRKGEAHFTVAKDALRPFWVTAGASEVRAVGTAFNIYRQQTGGIEVIVTEGRARVSLAAGGGDSALLDVGQRIEMTDTLSAVTLLDEAQLSQKLSWRDRMLVFEGETLEQALSVLKRYTSAELVITDPAIRTLQVGGYFKTDDFNGMLNSLEKVLPIHIQRVGNSLIYFSAKKQMR